ncbi:ATP-binding cassette domain-containing protein [Rhodobacteraceae bacterium 2CG4]|uniref:ATP-binding cassette domain-containing protein n=1 Tax=Halovulum marinum TaxID=2662447 RepID=A0A6L5Z4W3_9RHOB|nr:ABC transporter ATP-binding protein [Halovulum marinum]MSU91145.1 ATP-binding cassette domain-containing protein [Halovulum marinum]
MSALLSIRGLTKSYPGVLANSDIHFEVGTGEIHALLGENGAGKSTLVKAIYGLVTPDKGEMYVDGNLYEPRGPQAARAAGVSMVFQHFSLFEALNVAENIALGMSDPPGRAELWQRIRDVANAYGLPLDPGRLVGDLSVGERQRVEIVRCLLQSPRILIMDEPTSVLTPQEVDTLFRTLRQLASEGVAILYISHKLEEIRALCDRATILRSGRVVAECRPAEKTARQLAEMMIGLELTRPLPRLFTPGLPLLRLRGLTLPAATPFGTTLNNVSLELRAGEVLGIAGVAGNGQEELMRVLSGETRVDAEKLVLESRQIGAMGPNQRRQYGLLSAPEERLGHAAAGDMSLIENGFLTGNRRQRLAYRGFIKTATTANFARAVIRRFDVRTPSAETKARALSGGNLQKFVIGREILQRPKVLVVNQPTWGVDAHAAATIRTALRDLAAEGTGVLVISQDLDELMEISDTFSVLEAGRLSAPQRTGSLTIDEIGLMMGGSMRDHPGKDATRADA